MLTRNWLSIAAAAVLLPTAANADAIRVVTAQDNWSFTGTAQLPVKTMTTTRFANNTGQRFLVTFTAECAVIAPAGNFSAWIDVDIVVLNGAGAVVATLPPTVSNGDAFCSANGTAVIDGWQMTTVTAVGGSGLAAGNYTVEVRARLDSGATSGWLGERSLVVWR